jgi:deoxycytidine triphosphate deaminase
MVQESTAHPEYKYHDPHAADRGLLLSDQIDELCRAGFIISDGYDRKNLRPASYTLTIGERYIDSNGKPQRLKKVGDSFVFKKNSIVYVSTAEEFDLPYYVVARFNLRVHWVYEGILLGTGPQVDPGFRGTLSCPLYNLTSSDMTIKRGEPFATIDFEKTTSFLGESTSAEGKRSLLEKGTKDGGAVEASGRLYLLYRQKKLDALEHHPRQVLISSLVEMRNEVRTWRRIGVALVVAFVALSISLLLFDVNVYRQAVENLKELEQNRTQIELLEQRIPGKVDKPESGGQNENRPRQNPTGPKQQPPKNEGN